MIGRTNGGSGGGGASLSFKILTYTTETALLAASPAENTIGVVTTDTITSWIFAAEQPAEGSEGMLWIRTGTASAAAFNALKKNGITLYPISAMQYVGGVLVDVVAKSYIGGTWVDWWNGELYSSGNEYTAVTGGWVDYSGNTAGAVVEKESSFLKLTTGKHGTNTRIETANLIDMTEYSTLTLSGEIKSATTYCGWGLCDSEGKQVAFTTSAYSIDISKMSGLYRPFLQVRNSAEYITMTKMQMVR